MAKDVACGMRSFLLFLHLAHPFFPSPRPRFRRKSFRVLPRRSTWQRTLSVRRYHPMCPSPYLRCVRRASSKSPTITRDSTEDVWISDFHGFPLSPLLTGFIWFSTRVCRSFLFRFFFDVCLCVNYSTAFPVLYLYFLFLFFWASFRTKARKENVTKKNCPAIVVDSTRWSRFSNYKWRFALNIRLFILVWYFYCSFSLLYFSFYVFFSSKFRLYRSRFVVRFLFIFKCYYYSLGLAV